MFGGWCSTHSTHVNKPESTSATTRIQRTAIPAAYHLIPFEISPKRGPMKHSVLVLTVAALAAAQTQPKPAITPADYGKWETLGQGVLSPDGKWLAYTI